MEQRNRLKLSSVWACVQESYDLLQFVGSGSFGQVVKVQSKETGETFAIKRIKNVFHDNYHCKKVLREIMILR